MAGVKKPFLILSPHYSRGYVAINVHFVPYKVIVTVDMLGKIVWTCPFAPGTYADVLIWDGYGPSRTSGDFFDFEVGGHDGAYKGRIHVHVPFIGRKNRTLMARSSCTIMCMGGIWHARSICLDSCGIG